MTTRFKIYFICVNALLIIVTGLVMLPDRLQKLNTLAESYTMMQRRLYILQDEYIHKDRNMLFLENLDSKYIIQPAGSSGALLTDIRSKINNNNLQESHFSAGETTIIYADGLIIAEKTVEISADGTYSDIVFLIDELVNNNKYIKIDRIHISAEIDPDTDMTRLRLIFSIYEEI